MSLLVVKVNTYLLSSPAYWTPSVSSATLADLISPISFATPITPKMRFSSTVWPPFIDLIQKLPVPPEASGFITLYTETLYPVSAIRVAANVKVTVLPVLEHEWLHERVLVKLNPSSEGYWLGKVTWIFPPISRLLVSLNPNV